MFSVSIAREKRNRKVFLVVPPVADVTMPVLAPYLLKAFLVSHGVSCHVWDSSIELFNLLTSPHNLQKKVDSRIDHLDGFRSQLVRSGISLLTEYADRIDSISAGLKLLEFLEGRPVITFDGFGVPDGLSTGNFVSSLEKECEFVKPLITNLIQTRSFQIITSERSPIIGLSICFSTQLVPALALAAFFKEASSDCLVVLGGAYFSSWCYDPIKILCAFDAVDVIVSGPGEYALLSLAVGEKPADLPGVEHSVAGRVYIRWPDDARKIYKKMPDFRDVVWRSYTSGGRVAPYSFRKRCYYGCCKFCSGDQTFADGLITQAEVEQLGLTAQLYDLDAVYIVDAAVTPGVMKHIARALAPKAKWVANARPEVHFLDKRLLSFLADGGCHMLRFGFESGSQRVLDLMRKGTNVKTISDIIRRASHAGIRCHLYIMFGYPGETTEDRDKTIAFLEEHRDAIYSYSISVFQAIPGSGIYLELCERLGVDPSDEAKATSAIYAHIYPTEAQWNEIRKYVRMVPEVLGGSSLGNARCYSGRVFADVLCRGRTQRTRPIVVFESCSIDRQFWHKNFATVYYVCVPGKESGQRNIVAIDLARDTALILSGPAEESRVKDLIRAWGGCCDIQTKDIIEALGYKILMMQESGAETILQHFPTFAEPQCLCLVKSNCTVVAKET